MDLGMRETMNNPLAQHAQTRSSTVLKHYSAHPGFHFHLKKTMNSQVH